MQISNDSLYNKKYVCKQIIQDWNNSLLFYMLCFFFGSSAQLRLILYVALSRAKTIRTVSPNELHPKDCAIFWTGSGICTTWVLNITQKRGLDGNMSNCLKIDKRQKWVDYLFEQNSITSTKQYNENRLKKIERKLHKNIKRMKKVDLQTAIATIITNPNKKWKKLKSEKNRVPKSYFQNSWN